MDLDPTIVLGGEIINAIKQPDRDKRVILLIQRAVLRSDTALGEETILCLSWVAKFSAERH